MKKSLHNLLSYCRTLAYRQAGPSYIREILKLLMCLRLSNAASSVKLPTVNLLEGSEPGGRKRRNNCRSR